MVPSDPEPSDPQSWLPTYRSCLCPVPPVTEKGRGSCDPGVYPRVGRVTEYEHPVRGEYQSPESSRLRPPNLRRDRGPWSCMTPESLTLVVSRWEGDWLKRFRENLNQSRENGKFTIFMLSLVEFPTFSLPFFLPSSLFSYVLLFWSFLPEATENVNFSRLE